MRLGWKVGNKRTRHERCAFAIVGELVEEVDLPDAKAKLAILRLSDILIPGGLDEAQPAHSLSTRFESSMATPTEWHYNIDRNV